MLDLLRQRQGAQEVAEIIGERMELQPPFFAYGSDGMGDRFGSKPEVSDGNENVRSWG